MRKPISRIFGVALVLVASGVALYGAPVTMRFENVVYYVLRDRTRLNKFAQTYARVLHAVFAEEARLMYERHRRTPPATFRVVLADSAGALRRETGAAWFTAGLYDPERDLFFFQNPMRLQERGILRKTVAHEVCHQVVARAGTGNILSGPRERRIWLEESYCEAITASGNGCGRVSADVSRVVREARAPSDLQKVIETRGDRAAALRGLCLARLWGGHLTTRYGEASVFRWITTDRTEEIEKIPGKVEEAFTEFRAKFVEERPPQ